MTMTNNSIIVLFMMIMPIHSLADTIDTTGQAPYEQCGYCHEYDGNSLMPSYPRLAGQTSEYISKQLRDFRAGKRHGQMQATAELLSDQDIQIVAEYFSLQPVIVRKLEKLPTMQTKVAEQLVQQGDGERNIPACVSCHDKNVEGKKTFPRLAGQHQVYLFEQLLAFKTGERANDDQQQMQQISRALTEQEIRLLARYLASLVSPESQRKQSLNGQIGQQDG